MDEVPPYVAAPMAAAAGAATAAALQPLDVMRTHMQLYNAANLKAVGSHKPVNVPLSPPRLLAKLLRERAAWAGADAAAMRVGGGAAVHFATLQTLKRHVRRDGLPMSPLAVDALLGGTSRAVAVAALCPITNVKTRLEAAASAGRPIVSLPHALASALRAEGALALWRGLLPTIASNAPFSAVHYAVYRAAQVRLAPRLGDGLPLNFTAGAAAAAVATTVTQPFDVLRTRSMLQLGDSVPSLWKEPRAIFSGFGPRLVKRPLQTALLWSIYEEMVRLWCKLNGV